MLSSIGAFLQIAAMLLMAGVPDPFAVPRPQGAGQSLGRLDAGMDLQLAAAARQLHDAAGRRPALRPHGPGMETRRSEDITGGRQ